MKSARTHYMICHRAEVASMSEALALRNIAIVDTEQSNELTRCIFVNTSDEIAQAWNSTNPACYELSPYKKQTAEEGEIA